MNWLKKEEHKTLSKVEADGSLSEEAKIILRGIHKRHLTCADGPSEKDLDFLQKIYGVSIHLYDSCITFCDFRRSVTSLSDPKQQ